MQELYEWQNWNITKSVTKEKVLQVLHLLKNNIEFTHSKKIV